MARGRARVARTIGSIKPRIEGDGSGAGHAKIVVRNDYMLAVGGPFLQALVPRLQIRQRWAGNRHGEIAIERAAHGNVADGEAVAGDEVLPLERPVEDGVLRAEFDRRGVD